MNARIKGFYAVLDAHDEELARRLVQPIASGGAGARVLQVRIKPHAPVTAVNLVRAAQMARRVSAEFGAGLIVNDRLDIALAVGADGVHLGQDDLSLSDARAILERVNGPRLMIGISTHNLDQVHAAVDQGADYIGFGPIFPTRTKDAGPTVGLARLREAVAASTVPVVAIGGIHPGNVHAVVAAGAAAVCCISAVNQADDPVRAGVAVQAPWRGG